MTARLTLHTVVNGVKLIAVLHLVVFVGVISMEDVSRRVRNQSQQISRFLLTVWGNVILIVIASNTLLLVGSGLRKTVAHQALRVGVIRIVDVNHHVLMIHRMNRVH